VEAAPWDPNDARPEDFAAHYELRAACDAEILPDDDPTPAAVVEAELRHVPGFRKQHHWVVRDGAGRIIAASQLEWDDTGFNVKLAEIEVTVLPSHRGQGLTRPLLAPLADLAIRVGRTTLLADLPDRGTGPGFAARVGFRLGASERRNRLLVADLDPARLREWTKGVSGYEVVAWDGPTPDDLVEPFADLKTAESDAPWGNIPFERQLVAPDHVREKDQARAAGGFVVWTVAARAVGGRDLAAYTQLHWSPHWPEFAMQAWTAVAPAHRGQGLARWVKATNALRLLEERRSVTHVDTFNEITNAPMLAVNIDMGFQPLLEYGAWIAEAETVASYCGA